MNFEWDTVHNLKSEQEEAARKRQFCHQRVKREPIFC
jgi:hypothetical protein